MASPTKMLLPTPPPPRPSEAEPSHPCRTESAPGALPRVVFRLVPGHRHDESWSERPVRAPPDTGGAPSGALAYYNNSRTAANSNVLQVILRDHGYERVEAFGAAWSVFWCAGQVEPADLCQLLPHQKVNKFPKATALTLKANLWVHFKQMQAQHGAEHFAFMPTTFVLPRELKALERHLGEERRSGQLGSGVWIFKPAAAYCGKGIWLHGFGAQAASDGAWVMKSGFSLLSPTVVHRFAAFIRHVYALPQPQQEALMWRFGLPTRLPRNLPAKKRERLERWASWSKM